MSEISGFGETDGERAVFPLVILGGHIEFDYS